MRRGISLMMLVNSGSPVKLCCMRLCAFGMLVECKLVFTCKHKASYLDVDDLFSVCAEHV